MDSSTQMALPNSLLFQKEDQKSKGTNCLTCFCWFFQITTWIGIILIIIGALVDKEKYSTPALTFFGISYIIYIIAEFCSPMCSYLMNKKDNQGMYKKMRKLFITPPIINFHAECYHYVTHTKTRRDSEGKVHKYTERRKVISRVDSFNLPYYSVKDVSGLFLLNLELAQAKSKAFIQLDLNKEINFADTISYSDYIQTKNLFWQRNRYYDVHMTFRENRFIPGMDKHNLINISDYEPSFVGIGWFVLCVLFTFGQCYKNYIDSLSIYQKFTIRKLISTRYNLLEPQYIQQYQPLMPALNLVTQQYYYQPQETGYCSSDLQPILPTKEEIERAEQYSNQIPDYGVTSNNGVIQDIPQFIEQNYNDPPPAFTSIGGDIELNENQINQNININMVPSYINGNFDINNNNINNNINNNNYNYNPNQANNNNVNNNIPIMNTNDINNIQEKEIKDNINYDNLNDNNVNNNKDEKTELEYVSNNEMGIQSGVAQNNDFL